MAIDFTQQNKPGTVELKPQSHLTGMTLGSVSRGFLSGRKLQAADRMFFTEQLSLLLETGSSLTEALKLLIEYSESKQMKDMLAHIIDEIENGKTFSDALEQFPGLFSITYTNLIKASEIGGFMPKVLQELLAMDEKRASLRATIRSAISYPVFLLFFSFVVVLFVLVVIFPKFSSMFAPIMHELPVSTRVLMAISQSVIDNWILYLLFLGGSSMALFRWLSAERGKRQLDKLKLSLPVVKTIYAELYVVQSLRVMGLSLANGVSVIDTLRSCHEVVNNRTFQQFVISLEHEVQDGKGFAVGFTQARFIPPIVRQMIATGEESGSLPIVMTRVATYYESQLEKRLTTLSKAAEPVMLLLMGVIVGLLVSSLILPIFQLSNAAG